MPTLMDRLHGAYRGFREPALFADPDGAGRGRHSARGGADDWGAFDARRGRYLFFWALSQQQGYRDFVRGAAGARAAFGMYEGVRDLFGVAHQLNEFWTAHLQGGSLDPKMGDGKTAPSALPVLMDAEDPAVRGALAELAKRSNLAIVKDVAARYGSAVGDVFWEVCDDAGAQTARLRVVSAGRVKWCDAGAECNVEAYELEYRRPDPRRKPAAEAKDAPRVPDVLYNEVVTPEPSGGGYRWRTYLDGAAFAWPGNPSADFVIPDLPFAPLVKVEHKNIGMGWGQAEASASLPGSREVADLASCLTDWARKTLNSERLMVGMQDPALDAQAQARRAARPPTPAQLRSGFNGEFGGEFGGRDGQSAVESPVRGGMNRLWTTNPDAKTFSMVDPMPVTGVGEQIDRLSAKNRDDYPELSFERVRASGQASAEAIREARKPAEAKVYARRVEYDAGLARAMRMALTLGGLRGYRHYEGFTAGSYDEGRLDFRVGPRPAFAADPSEETAERLARYQAVKAATDAGLPLALAMREAGYSDQDVREAVAEQEKAARRAMDLAKAAPEPKPKQPPPG